MESGTPPTHRQQRLLREATPNGSRNAYKLVGRSWLREHLLELGEYRRVFIPQRGLRDTPYRLHSAASLVMRNVISLTANPERSFKNFEAIKTHKWP